MQMSGLPLSSSRTPDLAVHRPRADLWRLVCGPEMGLDLLEVVHAAEQADCRISLLRELEVLARLRVLTPIRAKPVQDGSYLFEQPQCLLSPAARCVARRSEVAPGLVLRFRLGDEPLEPGTHPVQIDDAEIQPSDLVW